MLAVLLQGAGELSLALHGDATKQDSDVVVRGGG